jgi:hypothetical protein
MPQLAKRRSATLSARGGAARALQVALQLLLAVLSRVLSPVLYPFSRIIALWLWSGRNLLKLAAFAREGSLHAVGWLSVPVHRRLQPWAAMFDMRRWHVVVGAFRMPRGGFRLPPF